jgi:glycosyltransferase involved in cell wall biosynthesis
MMDISVLFATANRAAILEDTLQHFAALDTTGLAWELVVVDNGSTDRTAEVLAAAGRRLPLTALHEPRPGKNVALNLALTRAHGRLLVFTDDDVVPDRRWLHALHEASARWPARRILAGRIVPRFPEGTPDWVPNCLFSGAAFARYDPPDPEGPIEQLPFGPNFAVQAAAMTGVQYNEAIGPRWGQDYAMGSETELLRRLVERGEKILYVPSAMVEHKIQPGQIDPQWLRGRSFRLGRGLTRLGLVNPPRPPLLFGVPAYLLPTLLRTWLRYLLSPLLGWQRHFDVTLEYDYLRGSLRELRQMSHEKERATP